MMTRLLVPALLAVVAGACVLTQQVLNANLRTLLNSAAWSGFVSYALGTLCMAALALALRDPVPEVGVMARVPWWAWCGGVLGAIFIGLAIVLVPALGAATFVALLVAGQMLVSVGFDHFGVLGLPQHPADLTRLIGVGLLVGGVLLIRL